MTGGKNFEQKFLLRLLVRNTRWSRRHTRGTGNSPIKRGSCQRFGAQCYEPCHISQWLTRTSSSIPSPTPSSILSAGEERERASNGIAIVSCSKVSFHHRKERRQLSKVNSSTVWVDEKPSMVFHHVCDVELSQGLLLEGKSSCDLCAGRALFQRHCHQAYFAPNLPIHVRRAQRARQTHMYSLSHELAPLAWSIWESECLPL